MQLTINRTELLKALKLVGRAVPSRSTLPALRTFNLSTQYGQLRLAATDLETYIRQTVPADVDNSGALCVNVLFAEFIAQVIGDEVTMRCEGNSLVVRCGRNQARFPVIDAAEFPVWPAEFTLLCRISSGVVNQIARRVLHAAATDETRPILTGVHITQGDKQLRMTTADGFRLATASVPVSNEAEFEATIPAKAVSALSAFQTGDLSIAQPVAGKTSQVLFYNDSLEVLSQVVMGKFPDVNSIIPTTYDTQVRVKREEMLHACRLLRVFAREARNALKLDVGPEQFVVTSEVSEAGDGHSVVDAEFAGKPVQLAVNADYLIDALAALDCEFVVLRFINSKCPLVIRPDRDEDCVAVIMPMNLQEGQCQKT
jgi:DNA polymerase-3 subunit beta